MRPGQECTFACGCARTDDRNLRSRGNGRLAHIPMGQRSKFPRVPFGSRLADLCRKDCAGGTAVVRCAFLRWKTKQDSRFRRAKSAVQFQEVPMICSKCLRDGAAIVLVGMLALPVAALAQAGGGGAAGGTAGASGSTGTAGSTGTTSTGTTGTAGATGTTGTSTTGIGGTGTSTGIGGTYNSAMPMPGSITPAPGTTSPTSTITPGTQLPNANGTGVPGAVGPYPTNPSGAYTNPNCAIAGSSCYGSSSTTTTPGTQTSPAQTTTPNGSAGATPK